MVVFRLWAIWGNAIANVHQAAVAKQIIGGSLKFLIAGLGRPSTGNKQGIPAGLDTVRTDYFTQPALHSIPNYGVSDPFASQNPKTALIEPVCKETNDQETISRTVAVSVDLGEPFGTG